MVDKDGNVFELSATGADNKDAKIKWVATKDGTTPPAGKQTEFVLSKNAKLFEKVYGNLTADAPEPPALLTKPQAGPPEEPLERRGAAAILQGPERERGPGVLDRVRALFKREPKPGEAAPKDERPAEPEVRPIKKSPYKTTALAGLEGAADKVPEMAPNLEPQFLTAPDRPAPGFALLDDPEKMSALMRGMTPEHQVEFEKKLVGLRDRYKAAQASVGPAPSPGFPSPAQPERGALVAKQRKDLAQIASETDQLLKERGDTAFTKAKAGEASVNLVKQMEAKAADAAKAAEAAKAADAAKAAEAQFRVTTPNPYSMFKKTIGVRPVAPGLTD
jgi:ElaB/YqjD/DUF883 family membrane-anchored ribosome-binding protein